MPENNSKINKYKILIKKIILILLIKLISYKKYSEASLSENIFITFISENNNLKHYKRKINNLNIHLINLEKLNLSKPNNTKNNYQKHNLIL